MEKENKNPRFHCSNPNCHKVFSKPKIIKYYVCPTCQTLAIMDTEIIQLNNEIKEEKDSLQDCKESFGKNKRKTKISNDNENEKSPEIQPGQISESSSELVWSRILANLESLARSKSHLSIEQQPETEKVENAQTENSHDFTDENLEVASSDLNSISIDENSEDSKKETQSTELLNEDYPVIEKEYEIEQNLVTKTEEDEGTTIFETDQSIGSIKENPKASIEKEEPNQKDNNCKNYFGYLNEKGKDREIPEYCFGCSKSIECMLGLKNIPSEKSESIKKWYTP